MIISIRGVWLQTPTHPTGFRATSRSYFFLISIISERISLLPPATQQEPSPILISEATDGWFFNSAILFSGGYMTEKIGNYHSTPAGLTCPYVLSSICTTGASVQHPRQATSSTEKSISEVLPESGSSFSSLLNASETRFAPFT